MRAWIDVATLVKTKNSKGRFAARAAAGLPFLLEAGDEVHLVPPKIDVPRIVEVGEVWDVGEFDAELTFEGVDDLGTAQQMVGMHCLIRRDLVDDSVYEDAPGTWEGWSVVDDELGTVGTVSGVVLNPMQTLLEVEKNDGSHALVPVVDEIVHDIDVDGCIVHVALPNGLLEL